jgi:hypothetical protein
MLTMAGLSSVTPSLTTRAIREAGKRRKDRRWDLLVRSKSTCDTMRHLGILHSRHQELLHTYRADFKRDGGGR